jgi:hypothetical protein
LMPPLSSVMNIDVELFENCALIVSVRYRVSLHYAVYSQWKVSPLLLAIVTVPSAEN